MIQCTTYNFFVLKNGCNLVHSNQHKIASMRLDFKLCINYILNLREGKIERNRERVRRIERERVRMKERDREWEGYTEREKEGYTEREKEGYQERESEKDRNWEWER